MDRIAHLTSVHQRGDTRIFLKQCRSLASAGYDVHLVVADGMGEETREGVHILDVGLSQGRLGRMAGATRRVLKRALQLDAALYHLHDPELLLVGLALKRRGRAVIFDAHEDLPAQILSKPYLRPAARRPLSFALGRLENFICRRLDAVVAATPTIARKFEREGIRAVAVNNYPMLGELLAEARTPAKAPEVCYAGGITAIRGIRELVAAMGMCTTSARLNLAGGFPETAVKKEISSAPGWARVNELGFISRQEMKEVLGRSLAGIVTFLPAPNHVSAQPNKMFEYMSAGLPVIASDFPLWREIIEGAGCGICVDPQDPAAIARAIDFLIENPEEASRMGEKGRNAVETRFNWGHEEAKLLELYSQILADRKYGAVPSHGA